MYVYVLAGYETKQPIHMSIPCHAIPKCDALTVTRVKLLSPLASILCSIVPPVSSLSDSTVDRLGFR